MINEDWGSPLGKLASINISRTPYTIDARPHSRRAGAVAGLRHTGGSRGQAEKLLSLERKRRLTASIGQ